MTETCGSSRFMKPLRRTVLIAGAVTMLAASVTAAQWPAAGNAPTPRIFSSAMRIEFQFPRSNSATRSTAPRKQCKPPFLDIQPVHALLADLPALTPEQDEQSAIVKADSSLRELAQPMPERGQRLSRILIANAGQAETCGADDAALTDFIAAHQVVHHFALLDGLQNFF
jgi:hypothetical protein